MPTPRSYRALLSGHRRSLEAMIAMNAQAKVGRIERLILDGLDAEARKYLRRIARHERAPVDGPFGTAGTFGENGAAPAIRDIVRQAEYHRIAGSAAHREAALSARVERQRRAA